MMDERQQATETLLEAITKIALETPDQLPLFIAECTSVLAMSGFTQDELAQFDVNVQQIIEDYLGGQLIDFDVVRDNKNIH